MTPFLGRFLGKPAPVPNQRLPLRAGTRATPRKTLALVLMALLAFSPSVTYADFVAPTVITVDGTFTDWTGNVQSQGDGGSGGANAGSANDITTVWYAMSTATGNSPASTVQISGSGFQPDETAQFQALPIGFDENNRPGRSAGSRPDGGLSPCP